jgi:hypothetical protein
MLAHAKLKRAADPMENEVGEDLPSWAYTRKKHHMIYNMGSHQADMIEYQLKKVPVPSVSGKKSS